MRSFRSAAVICCFVAVSGMLPISAFALAKHTASASNAMQADMQAQADDMFSQYGVAP